MVKAVCPQCGGAGEYKPKLKHFYNRVYQCKRCQAVFGVPTTYGKCRLYGVVESDKFYNQCRECQHFPKYPEILACPFYIGAPTVQEMEEKFRHARELDFEPEKIDVTKIRRQLDEQNKNSR